MLACNSAYVKMLRDIVTNGVRQESRGLRYVELINYTSKIPMSQPLVTLPARKLGVRYACGEAAWILRGDYKVTTIAPYSKIIGRFSDDGMFYFGAYGPKIVQQLPYIISALKKDLYTRQAVITIWRESPLETKDVPCTLAVQFLVRREDGINYLHCLDTMRSSDAWLGIPYDWFTFSMLSAYLCLCLKHLNIADVRLGNLILTAGSEHLYTDDKFGYTLHDVENVEREQNELFYAPINLSDFADPDELIHMLKLRADKMGHNYEWLKEI